MAAGAWASRRRGPPAAALSAVALAGGVYWLVHASVDWFWPYPAVTAAAFGLLGVGCAAAGLVEGEPRWRPWRAVALAALAVLALSAIPPFLSERYVDHAYGTGEPTSNGPTTTSIGPRSLNPLSDLPILAEGAIATRGGRRAARDRAFEDAPSSGPRNGRRTTCSPTLKQRSDPARRPARDPDRLELNPLERRRPSARPRQTRASAPGGRGSSAGPRRRRSGRGAGRGRPPGRGSRRPSFALALRTWVWTVAGESAEQLRRLGVGRAGGQQRQHLALARGRHAASPAVAEHRRCLSAARFAGPDSGGVSSEIRWRAGQHGRR